MIPGWKSVAAPPSAQSDQLVQLQDGRIFRLAVPLDDDRAASQIYDPQTDTWTETARPLVRATGRGLVVTAEGWVLASGGLDGGTSLKSCELYDADANVWHVMPELMTAMHEHAAVCARGRVFAIDHSTLLSWAPGDPQWRLEKMLPQDVVGAHAWLLDDESFVVRPRRPSRNPKALRWDHQAWTSIDDIDRWAPLVAMRGTVGFIQIACAGNNFDHAATSVRQWTLQHGWRNLPELPSHRRHPHALRLADGRIVVIGGTMPTWATDDKGQLIQAPADYVFIQWGNNWDAQEAPPLHGRHVFPLPDGRVVVFDHAGSMIWTPPTS